MNTFPATLDEVLLVFPGLEQWLQTVGEFKKDLDRNKIEFFYTFGFFVTKTNNKEELYTKMYQASSDLKYPARLKYELSKVRVNLTLRAGNFILQDRMPRGIIPPIIADVVAEITKIKMILETEEQPNREISQSIPELNKDLVSFENLREYVKDSAEDLDLDSILDKISSKGLGSLSDLEKEFLDNKSKGQ